MTIYAKISVAVAAAALTIAPAIAQNYGLDPAYGTIALATGFEPDPYQVELRSGGPVDAAGLGSPCVGYIANAPDVRLNFTGGSSLPLVLSVSSSVDTTLVVNDPNGEWYCDDDGGNNGLNPSIAFDRPASGQYDIWIGTYSNTSLQPAVLNISELYSD